MDHQLWSEKDYFYLLVNVNYQLTFLNLSLDFHLNSSSISKDCLGILLGLLHLSFNHQIEFC